jgi:DNA-binding NarL/FixJ family response regulator
VPALELLIHALAGRGALSEAAAVLSELRAVARLVGTAPLRAAADMAEGVVAAGAGDHDRACRLLEDALDTFETCGAPFESAVARLELATSLAAAGRGDAALREARSSLEVLTALGAEGMARRARRLADGPNRGHPVTKVTRRERDVLHRIVEGLTNREIAERLFISEHTVHRHVANILRKLDVSSRTAAAAHAVRAGLCGPSGE